MNRLQQLKISLYKQNIKVAWKFGINLEESPEDRETIKQSVDRKIQKVEDILENGLDIGGIKGSIIDVSLVKEYNNYYFYNEEKGLFPVTTNKEIMKA